jgi:hypothetical protein
MEPAVRELTLDFSCIEGNGERTSRRCWVLHSENAMEVLLW